ncbi:MAG: hypothetical protein QXU18_12550 [Thermoplasmatales archaeon]
MVVCGLIALVPSVSVSLFIRETGRKGMVREGISSMRGKLALNTAAFSAVVAGAFMFRVPLMGVVPTYL